MKTKGIIILAFLLSHAINVSATTRYVDLNSTNSTSPFIDWSTAATNIQAAIDVASAGDLVLVTNGIYQSGGRPFNGSLTNRVVVNKAVMLQSVNGPEFTVIQGLQKPSGTNGAGAIRCVYLTSGAALNGFTLAKGGTLTSAIGAGSDLDGGGVYCARTDAHVTNCLLLANAAARSGGGIFGGSLDSCILDGNSVFPNFSSIGGGAANSILNECVISNSFATSHGGGLANSIATNCTISFNQSGMGSGGGASDSTLVRCMIFKNRGGQGGGAVGGSVISSVLFSNSATAGGGTSGSRMFNCLITNNSATFGGGLDSPFSAINCVIFGNTANQGGGVAGGVLYNCTVIKNVATNGIGGVWGIGSANNCIIYYNSGSVQPNFVINPLFSCCTFPMPTNGLNNITNAPSFIDLAGNDLRLQSDSPCINSGTGVPTESVDLDNLPRISGGNVDIGAFEFQDPSSQISFAWLQQFDLSTDGSMDFTDNDRDNMNNWQEWRAGTIPTNSASLLQMFPPTVSNTNTVLSWQSITGKSYFLERADSFETGFVKIQSDIPGQQSITLFTNALTTNAAASFYRVGVQ